MTTATNHQFREGNRSLDYLITNYQPLDPKVAALVELIPKVAEELYSQARKNATLDCFTGTTNPVSSVIRMLGGASSDRQTLLIQCIFDLILTVYFQEVYEYCADKEVASLLTDSLLYQATGLKPSSPTELQIREEGTHTIRGIHKFALADKQMSHIGDIVAWIFGKEIAALQGTTRDMAIILSVAPISVMLRAHAKWAIRYFLYGTLPTKADERNLDEIIAEMQKDVRNVFSKDT